MTMKRACRDEAAKALEKYSVVAASAVIATGALYVLLGLCCCRGIRRGAQLRYRRRLAHAELQRAYLAERAFGRGRPWPRPYGTRALYACDAPRHRAT